MAAADQPALVTSRYNFCVPVTGGSLLFNTNSGALLRFEGADAVAGAKAFCSSPQSMAADAVPPEVLEQLVEGGFVVDEGRDEVKEIRERFWQARGSTPIVLTLTTTMDCNLGCYYCYEERSSDRLEISDVGAVVDLARNRLARSGKRSLHVDWYGGEPLMNVEFMEAASLALQGVCRKMACTYAASVISNGTCWPADVGSFVLRHMIRQVQISFDGMKENHERRRRFRKGYENPDETSSFDLAVDLVDRLLDHTRVDLRFNTDRGNADDVFDFLAMARERGWFERRFQAVVQPARLASYSEHSSFMRKSELSLEEFDALRARVRSAVAGDAPIEESEAPSGFPHPKRSVCAALAEDSVVVGAEGKLYRCGLQVGEDGRSVGEMTAGRPAPLLPVLQPSDDRWWADFDPTDLESCSVCSFLPICWGGCPKKHLEGDSHALDEQGAYWRSNLPRLVAGAVGEEPLGAIVLSESDQFR